jgi:DNA-binding response OmpR family regulator
MTRVLVVDDEVEIRNLVAYSLSRFEVRTAASGAEALRAVAEEQPDVVVLDIMMPGLSGLGVLERLRADPVTARLPVILLTAKAHEAEVAHGYELGASDYVVKPFNPLELARRVQALAGEDS